MNGSRSRRRIRLTPFGYLVLSAFIVVILLCVYLVARAAGGASLSPEGGITGSGSPLGAKDPDQSIQAGGEGGALENLENLVPAASATTLEPSAEPTAPATPTIYLTPAPNPTAPPTPSPSPAAISRTPSVEEVAGAREGKLSTGGVNLRAGPSTNDNIIGTDYAKGTKLMVYGLENDFYFVQIIAKSKYGFISSKFVSVAGITPEPIITQVPAGAVGGRISASTVALRRGPGTDYGMQGQFPKDTPVYIFFRTGDWFYLQIAETGVYGYMKADFIAAESEPPSGTPLP